MILHIDNGIWEGNLAVMVPSAGTLLGIHPPAPWAWLLALAGIARVHMAPVPQQGHLLGRSPNVASHPQFLQPCPRDSEGLGQAAVLHVARVRGSVLRGDPHHHPGLVRAISTGKNVSPRLSLLCSTSASPAQTDSSWVEVIGQALEGPVLSWGHVAGDRHGGRGCGGTERGCQGPEVAQHTAPHPLPTRGCQGCAGP